jgi:hypothetical protein
MAPGYSRIAVRYRAVFEDGGEVFENGGEVFEDSGEIFEDDGEVSEDGGEIFEDDGEVFEDDGKVFMKTVARYLRKLIDVCHTGCSCTVALLQQTVDTHQLDYLDCQCITATLAATSTCRPTLQPSYLESWTCLRPCRSRVYVE